MAMNRRAAVASKLLKQAGYTGDLMRLAESLPPETLVQFDKLLNHKEPSVGPGMDSGIVVAYKSGEVVQDRPMQGNFSEEGIAVYEDGGAVEPRPTGLTLSNGRPVWQSGDDMYSEKTITVPYGEGWVNVPTVDVDGSILSEEEVIRLLDQIGPVDIVTGEPLPVFDRLAVAEQKASQRSVNLNMELKDATQEQAPPVALELSDDVYLRPQFDARFGISESNRRVPFFEDTVKIRDRNMGGIARLGAEVGFPGFSGNDRLSGGVTGTYDRTKRLFPDEYKPFGYPSDARFGPRGVVPVGYDVNYSSGKHKFSANVTPRQEGVSRDAPGGRSVYNLGYTYSTPEASYYLEATPFGVRENPDPKTGAAKMVRPFRAGVKIPF